MVEDAVQDDTDSPRVGLSDKPCEKPVARLEVGRVGDPRQVERRVPVGPGTPLFLLLTCLHDPAEMRIYMFIVLGVIFMAGRGQEDGV